MGRKPKYASAEERKEAARIRRINNEGRRELERMARGEPVNFA